SKDSLHRILQVQPPWAAGTLLPSFDFRLGQVALRCDGGCAARGLQIPPPQLIRRFHVSTKAWCFCSRRVHSPSATSVARGFSMPGRSRCPGLLSSAEVLGWLVPPAPTSCDRRARSRPVTTVQVEIKPVG